MLCYAMLCYAMLCYAMLCYAMLRYAMLAKENASYELKYSFFIFFDFGVPGLTKRSLWLVAS
jgi:hypothetical protein